jgi:hypothetical protein
MAPKIFVVPLARDCHVEPPFVVFEKIPRSPTMYPVFTLGKKIDKRELLVPEGRGNQPDWEYAID